MRVEVVLVGLLVSFEVVAQDQPAWVTLLPQGEIQCQVESSHGFEWHQDVDKFVPVRFPTRKFAIQRLDASDPKYASFNCGPNEKPGAMPFDNAYSTSACYRYNNTSNMLGWIQGWCSEKYKRNGTVQVTCESNKDFEPRIGFAPNGYFYSYGRSYTLSEDDPFIRAGFTEIGQCDGFRPYYANRFKIGSKSAYYAPGR